MNDLGFKRRDPAEIPTIPVSTGIPKGAIKLDDAQAERAGRAGEALGFRSREPASTPLDKSPPSGRRQKGAIPSKSVFIKGPESLIDWFITYTDSGEFRSYWEALADLRQKAGL
jgi:hypothetical protein